MNEVAQFFASNMRVEDTIIFLIVGIALICGIMMIPYFRIHKAIRKRPELSSERKTDLCAYTGIAFMAGCMLGCVVFIAGIVMPMMQSYTDCSCTVEGRIIIPGYENVERDFTLCRKREYYGAPWGEWFVADMPLKDKLQEETDLEVVLVNSIRVISDYKHTTTTIVKCNTLRTAFLQAYIERITRE